MRFLLDESADIRLATYLSERGQDVRILARDYTPGLPDREVLKLARRERRVLITNDRDFGELIFRQSLPHAGVILFRLRATDLASKRLWLERILTRYADQLTQFLVVTERGIRVRRTGPK